MVGSGISNADDYKSINVSLYTANGDRLGLTGGNAERDLRGHSWKGEVKEIGADGFSIHFEMPKGFDITKLQFHLV